MLALGQQAAVLAELGRLEEAVGVDQRAMTMAPDMVDDDLLTRQAELLLRRGDKDQGEALHHCTLAVVKYTQRTGVKPWNNQRDHIHIPSLTSPHSPRRGGDLPSMAVKRFIGNLQPELYPPPRHTSNPAEAVLRRIIRGRSARARGDNFETPPALFRPWTLLSDLLEGKGTAAAKEEAERLRGERRRAEEEDEVIRREALREVSGLRVEVERLRGGHHHPWGGKATLVVGICQSE